MRCRRACRACPARTSGRRCPCGAGRRTLFRCRPERAWPEQGSPPYTSTIRAMDGYFDDSSMLRRVHRETAVAFSGPRALLMQATHPVAFEGFFAHSGALADPYGRLRRTAKVMNTIGFGSRAEADRATRRVRAMHRRVRGELAQPAGRFPAGTPFAADDPELLLWVLATLVDS